MRSTVSRFALLLALLLAFGTGCEISDRAQTDPGLDASVATGGDSGEDETPLPEPDSGEPSDPGEDAGVSEPPDASDDDPSEDPDAGSASIGDTGPDYVEPDNCTSAEASKIPSAPSVIFRWRAGAPASANTKGTLTATLQSIARPAGLGAFNFAHFEPTQYFVGDTAMANPTAGLTVQAWFRAAEVAAGYQTLFSNTESTRGFSLDIKDGRLIFAFSVNAGGTAKRYWVPDPADPANASLPRLEIAPDRWTHVSVTLHKYSDRYFVRFMVDEKWAYSVNVAVTDPLYNSTSMPTVGAESAAAGPTAEGFHGDIHAVVVQNYAVDRNFSTAPALRDGSAYFGLPAYHDYLGSESAGSAAASPPYSNQTWSSNRRVWQADRNSLWPAMIGRARTRLTLPLLNDGYRPQGAALSGDGRTLWLTYVYADASGANPKGLADLLVAADLPGKTVRTVYRLTQSGSNLTSKLGGLAEARGWLYLLVDGKLWRAQPSTATSEETADPGLPGALDVFSLALDPAYSYPVRATGPGVSYDAASNSLWLASYVTDATKTTPLDRYALTADGGGLAHPSNTASDERVEVPAGVRFVQGVLRVPGTSCFALSSFDRDAAPGTMSKTASAVWAWCDDGALAKSAVLAPAAAGLFAGPGPTAWLLFQSGAVELQKRTSAEPLHDTLVPYVLGFSAGSLLHDHVGALPRSAALKTYRGDLHAHSSNSDDAAKRDPPPGSPATCYSRAKTNGLDFLYLSDHVTWGWSNDTEWAACKSAATSKTSAGFLAMCGLETSMKITDSLGTRSNHSNVFFHTGSWKDFSSFTGHASFFTKLASKKDAIAQFNHPASDTYLWAPPAPTDATDAQMHLVEFNGAPTDAARFAKYAGFLDKGWHVAPTWNSDSHTGAESAKSAFWMASLDAAELKAAMVGHRSFVHNSKSDVTGTLKVFADGVWMGAILRGYVAAPLEVTATHSKGIAKIELVGPSGKVLHTLQCAGATTCTKTQTLSPPPKWIYAKAYQTNGNFMVSAPTWFE